MRLYSRLINWSGGGTLQTEGEDMHDRSTQEVFPDGGTLQTEGGDMKDRLFELGFEVLDYIYGELAIEDGELFYDEIFVDKYDELRLGYDKPGSKKRSLLSYLYKDREFFLNIIPVEEVDFERVLKAWVEERYKRKAETI